MRNIFDDFRNHMRNGSWSRSQLGGKVEVGWCWRCEKRATLVRDPRIDDEIGICQSCAAFRGDLPSHEKCSICGNPKMAIEDGTGIGVCPRCDQDTTQGIVWPNDYIEWHPGMRYPGERS